jgi:amino acid permease
LRGSIFAFLASAMGTGLFNLPKRASEMGLIFFSIEVIVGGIFSWIGMVFMVSLIQKYKYTSYIEMSISAYGVHLKRLSQICIIVYPWGITICFQVILAQFFC